MSTQSTDIRADKASRVTWVGFFVNLALTAFKLMAGIVGHSAAMVADSLHSLSDFATDIVVLVCFRIIGKPVDKSHDYGHGKYETLATALIGLALLGVGLGIFWAGAKNIWSGLHGVHLEPPAPIALFAAILSIVMKEWLYRFTASVGREIDSQAVIANAWHHRSDAFSSIGTLIGIGGAITLGENWHFLDPLAAVVVSFFIIKMAVTITLGSCRELTEESLEEAVEKEISTIVTSVEGTVRPHNLRTRRIGNSIAIDIHVCVAGDMRMTDAHNIASNVEDALRGRFGEGAFVSIHLEPE